jgi:DNA-directed RNA polymerase specialized sigma24 family protein
VDETRSNSQRSAIDHEMGTRNLVEFARRLAASEPFTPVRNQARVDEASVVVAFDTLSSFAVRLLMRRSGLARQDLADCRQEVITRLWRWLAGSKLASIRRPRGFLHMVVKSVFINHMLKGARQPYLSDPFELSSMEKMGRWPEEEFDLDDFCLYLSQRGAGWLIKTVLALWQSNGSIPAARRVLGISAKTLRGRRARINTYMDQYLAFGT